MGARLRGYRWRWRRNALRRRSDAVEAWTALALGTTLFLGGPAAALAAGWSVYTQDRATAAEQAASRERVRAVLLQDAPPPIPSAEGIVNVEKYQVAVRWTARDGGTEVGVAPVSAGSKRGERTDVWLDAQGRVAASPKGDADVWLETFAAGSGAAACTALVVAGLRMAVRRAADRHRMAEWERDWSRTEPEWSRRRA
ncbi:Rv1733c family protein [Streptomyces sp. NPDC001514]